MRNNDTACPSPLPPRPGSRYGIRVCPRKNASPGDSLLPPRVARGIIVRRAARVVREQEDGGGGCF